MTEPSSHRSLRRQGFRVLVVEDDAPVRNLIALTLRRENLSVCTARDGAEAIDHLARQSFRIVLLDLMMPRVSGWDVIAWLKENPSKRPYSLIVVTAADRNVFAKLDPDLVNAILVKPFDTYEFAGYVQRCCEVPLDRDRRKKRIVGNV